MYYNTHTQNKRIANIYLKKKLFYISALCLNAPKAVGASIAGNFRSRCA